MERRGTRVRITGFAPRAFVAERMRAARAARGKERGMLHMVVNSHNAESCAYRGDAEDEALSGALKALNDRSGEHEVKVQGSWVNRASHEIFILAEAPHAHAIESALVTAGLVGRTHSRILPVRSTQDVLDEENATR